MKPHYDLSIAFSDSFSLIKKQPRRALLLSLIGGVTGLVSFEDVSNSLGWVPLVIIGAILMLVPTAFLSAMTVVLYSGPFASAWVQLRPRPLAAEPRAFERM